MKPPSTTASELQTWSTHDLLDLIQHVADGLRGSGISPITELLEVVHARLRDLSERVGNEGK